MVSIRWKSVRQKAKLSTSNFDARNRIGVNMSAFDPDTGNQTAIGGYSFTYDGGGRMISAKSAGLSTGYVYDGDGQRIQKVACPGGTLVCTASVDQAVITTYVYDASGGLAAEYTSQSSTSACGTPTCYVSVDQIGSTRLLTDNSGAVIRRYDYLPYGEELWAGTGSRTTTMGYQSGPDGFNPKFTGQWRDTESRFDYFNARYYSPEQGRFVSPDPGNAGAQLGDPLTWHGYAYVGNNPLNVTDPDGLGFLSDLGGLFAGLFGSGEIWNTVQNDGPWNERLPGGSIGSLGGSVNTGGVFGDGQIGGGPAFSFADAQTQAPGTEMGFLESLIPIWGSGRQASWDYKRGCYQGAILNGALAVSDVALVKSAAMAGAKGAFKTGSMTWAATRAWYAASREVAAGIPIHHWAIPQNGWGKNIPTWIKNQPWNLLPVVPPKGSPFSPQQFHNLIEGKTLRSGPLAGQTMDALDRFVYGVPGWAKNAAGNLIGKQIQGLQWWECNATAK